MYKKILCIGVALIMSASFALANYYIVNPDGDMFRARKVDKGYEPIEETPSLSMKDFSEGKGFVDTVYLFRPEVPFYYCPDRDSNSLWIQLFNYEYACSLVAFGADLYSEGWAEFSIWEGPDPIPATTEELLAQMETAWTYDSASNAWTQTPTVIYGPVPVGSDEPGELVGRTCWVTLTSQIDIGTSAVWAGFRTITRRTGDAANYGGKPWPSLDGGVALAGLPPHYTPCRSWLGRIQSYPDDIRGWQSYGDNTGDWPFYYVVDIYVNAPPSVSMEKLDGTYSTEDKIINITTFDFDPDAANAGIDEANSHFYYTVDGGAQQEATLVQDSVTPGVGEEIAWWHGIIPGTGKEGTKITYWVEVTDGGGLTTVVPEHFYTVKSGTPGYGLLYVEGDDAYGTEGVHDAFASLSWDIWNEIFDNPSAGYGVDTTVTDFYASGSGGRAFAWLGWQGYDFAEFTFTEEFMAFMDGGGCVFLSSEDVVGGGYGLGYGDWVAPDSPHPLREYLKAYAGTDDYIDVSPFAVFVDNSDVVTTGMPDEVSVDCELIYATYVGIFTDLDADCIPLFFDGEGNIIGYRYEAPGGFKVVFLYFPFHAITDTDAQDTFISNITSWFGLEVGAEENPEELVYNLPMVNPNPLSRSTTINFSIGKSEYVSVKVYDVTGSLVIKLVDESLTAGTHTLTINTESLAPGVYFLRMDAGTFSGTRKFVVMK